MEADSETSVCVKNIDDICRVCLSSDEINEFIFRNEIKVSDIEDTFTLSEKLKLYGGIEVSSAISFNLNN